MGRSVQNFVYSVRILRDIDDAMIFDKIGMNQLFLIPIS